MDSLLLHNPQTLIITKCRIPVILELYSHLPLIITVHLSIPAILHPSHLIGCLQISFSSPFLFSFLFHSLFFFISFPPFPVNCISQEEPPMIISFATLDCCVTRLDHQDLWGFCSSLFSVSLHCSDDIMFRYDSPWNLLRNAAFLLSNCLCVIVGIRMMKTQLGISLKNPDYNKSVIIALT